MNGRNESCFRPVDPHHKANDFRRILRTDRGQLKRPCGNRIERLTVVLLTPAGPDSANANLAFQETVNSQVNRVASSLTSLYVEPLPVRHSVGGIFQYVQDSNHDAVVEGDMSRITRGGRVTLRESAVWILGVQHEIETAQACITTGVGFHLKESLCQKVDLGVNVVIVERRIILISRGFDRMLLRLRQNRQHVVIFGPTAICSLEQQNVGNDFFDLVCRIDGLVFLRLDDPGIVSNTAPVTGGIAKPRSVDGCSRCDSREKEQTPDGRDLPHRLDSSMC